MILTDVNILIYAFRRDAERHKEYRKWLADRLTHEPVFGYSEGLLSGFLRVVTHPKVFVKPSKIEEAFTFTEYIRSASNTVSIAPGEKHWAIFQRLCRQAGAKGNLVADAYWAALAVESGCLWVTADRDFARFPGLKYIHPLDKPG